MTPNHSRLAVLLGLLCALGGSARAGAAEAKVTLDIKDADIHSIVNALAEVAGIQAVFDPGLTCRLTLSVRELSWREAFAASLSACGLGYEEDGKVVRIAPRERLTTESAERRKLADQKRLDRPRRVERLRLSYARAQELAPLVKRFLSERGEVVWDERTNTLIIID